MVTRLSTTAAIYKCPTIRVTGRPRRLQAKLGYRGLQTNLVLADEWTWTTGHKPVHVNVHVLRRFAPVTMTWTGVEVIVTGDNDANLEARVEADSVDRDVVHPSSDRRHGRLLNDVCRTVVACLTGL